MTALWQKRRSWDSCGNARVLVSSYLQGSLASQMMVLYNSAVFAGYNVYQLFFTSYMTLFVTKKCLILHFWPMVIFGFHSS